MKKHNNLTPEEEALRNKMDELHFDYQEADWLEVEQKLKPSNGSWSFGRKIFLAASVAAVAISAAYIFNQESDSVNSQQVGQTQTVDQFTNPTQNNSNVVTDLDSQTGVEEQSDESLEQSKNANKSNEVKTSKLDVVADAVKSEESNVKQDKETEEQLVKKTDNQTAPINAAVQPAFESASLLIDGKICAGEEISIRTKIKGQEAIESYQWKLNRENLDYPLDGFKLQLDENQDYKVELSLLIWTKSSKSSQVVIDTFIQVSELPKVNISYTDGEGMFDDFKAEINAVSNQNKLSYTWYVNEQQIGNTSQATYNSQKAGVYPLKLVVKDPSGCENSIEENLLIDENFGPFINAFTPENPDGTNDTFMPNGFENFDGNFLFTVYDLNGNVIYQTKSNREPWNGRVGNNGSLQNPGYYIWEVKVSNNKGESKSFKERIQLKSF